MAYREFDQPKVRDLRPADYGVLGHMLGGVEKFPAVDYGTQDRARLHAESEKAKRLLSYEVGKGTGMTEGQQKDVQFSVDEAVNDVNAGRNPLRSNADITNKANQSKVTHDLWTKTQEDKKNLDTELGGGTLNPEREKKYDTEYNGLNIKDASGHVANERNLLGKDLSNVFSHDRAVQNFMDKTPENKFIFGDKKERGLTTFGDEQTLNFKFHTDDKTQPVLEYDKLGRSTQVLVNGVPQFKPKAVETVEEASPYVDKYFSNQTAKAVALSHASKKTDEIDKLVNDAIALDPNFDKSDKVAMESARNNAIDKIARNDVAQKIISDEKGRSAIEKASRVVTKKEATESEKEASRQYTGRSGDKNQPEQTVSTTNRIFSMKSASGGKDVGEQKQVAPISFGIFDNKGKLIGQNTKILPVEGIFSKSTGKEIDSVDLPEKADFNGVVYLITKTDSKGNKTLDVTKETDHVKRVADLRKMGYDVDVEPYESFNAYSAKNPFSKGAEKDEYAEMLTLRSANSDSDRLKALESKFAKHVDEIFVPADVSTVSKFKETNKELLLKTGNKKAIDTYKDINKAIEETPKGSSEETFKLLSASKEYNTSNTIEEKQDVLDKYNLKKVDNKLVPKTSTPVAKPKEEVKDASSFYNKYKTTKD